MRRATDDDVPAIRELRRAWAEEDAGGPIDDDGYEARFAAWWDAQRHQRRHWVVEDGGAVVGMASVVLVERMPQPGGPGSRWGYVHHVVVAPDRRARGIGAELFDAVADECRADGLEHLLLHTRARSRPFYERLGFVDADGLLRLALR